MTTSTPSHTVEAWLVGGWSSGEFHALRSELPELKEFPHVESLEAANRRIAEQECAPELLLVALPRPGTLGQDEVDTFARLSPLTRIVSVAGTWCEGELRTGRPLTGVVRVYWHELPVWWRSAMSALSAGKSPPWSAALDNPLAGREIVQPAKLEECTGQIIIDAVDFAVFSTLDAVLSAYGWNCEWQPRHRPEKWSLLTANNCVAIWDGSQLDADELENLQAFVKRMSGQEISVVALLDFPRGEHLRLAQDLGVAEIIAKPYQVAGLMQILDRI